MGLDTTLCVIPRREYRKYPGVNPAAVAEFQLHREWMFLDRALQSPRKPIGLAIRGDRQPLEAFDGDWDAYIAFVTPATVKKIDNAFTEVSEEDFVAALKAAGATVRKREVAGWLAAFNELKAAYRKAVEEDGYIRIFIC